MDLDERVKVARLAYIRAVARIRQSPDAAAWAQLRAAAVRLNDAIEDQRRAEHPAPPQR